MLRTKSARPVRTFDEAEKRIAALCPKRTSFWIRSELNRFNGKYSTSSDRRYSCSAYRHGEDGAWFHVEAKSPAKLVAAVIAAMVKPPEAHCKCDAEIIPPKQPEPARPKLETDEAPRLPAPPVVGLPAPTLAALPAPRPRQLVLTDEGSKP